jgi:uncharacterized membrane-anchored protein YhcB (DUF1043 family)
VTVSPLAFDALDLLQQVVQEAHDLSPKAAPLEDGFVYRHANNISWLAADALFLMENDRIATPPIIVRAISESTIYLAASKSHRDFAARKTVWELKGYLRRIRKLGMEAAIRELIPQMEQKIRDIQTKHSLDPDEEEWSVSECAQKSELVDFLRKNYFSLSQHSHSAAAALLARHGGTDARVATQTLIGCMLMASAFAAQLLPTLTPRQHVDRATALLDQLVNMIEKREI